MCIGMWAYVLGPGLHTGLESRLWQRSPTFLAPETGFVGDNFPAATRAKGPSLARLRSPPAVRFLTRQGQVLFRGLVVGGP